MKILVVDFSNNSINFALFEDNSEKLIVEGFFERIGLEKSKYTFTYEEQNIIEEIEVSSHEVAVEILLARLVDLELIASYDEIRAVGYKIIHGSDKYGDSVLINEFVIAELEKLSDLSFFNISVVLNGVKAFKKMLPTTAMVGVFDTAFYNNLKNDKYLYSVPYKWYTDYNVKKYGFNGINHREILNLVSNSMGKKSFKLISCYAEKDVSISAVKDMECIDTSMGFTKLGGAIMSTKSGDIDSSIIPYIMEKEGKSATEVIEDLNTRSGLLGISEYSDSILDILTKAASGDEKCIIAKDMYIRRIVDYISKYYVLLEGADIIAFSGSDLFNSSELRKEICNKLAILGINIDSNLNNNVKGFMKVSSASSKIDVYVVPTREISIIADETFKYVENR